jgi:hypothetical protein
MGNTNWQDMTTVKKGDLGEKIVDDYLLSKGIIPYKSISQTAHPFDRLCATSNKKNIFIAEVKSKAKMKYYPATGFNLNHYKQYKYIQEKYNIKIMVYFVDEKLNKVYGNYLNILSKETEYKNKKYPIILKNNIIIFPECNMIDICNITDDYSNELKKLTNSNY